MADHKTIVHIGVKRRSGRYPWGSGGDNDILGTIDRLAKEGFSEVEIAEALEMSTTELRNQKSLAKQEQKEDRRLQANKLKAAGMSIAAISKEMDLPQQTVRDLLLPWANMKHRVVKNSVKLLKDLVSKYGFVDVGEGSEIFMGITTSQMSNALQLLKNEGYVIHTIRQEQLGARDKQTIVKVLAAPGTDWKTVNANKHKMVIPNFEPDADGELALVPEAVKNISSKKVLVKYANDGGAEKDGLLELRKGVPELNLGGKNYAQVRIGVDGTHFMKGMAVLRDDLPDGIDIIYNTKKMPTGNPLDAMKPQKVDDEAAISQFGSVITPNRYIDKNGKEQIGMVNIVGDKKSAVEGSWADWNNTLASQVLSKQAPRIAEKQLGIIKDNYEAELAEISSLTNPTIKNHLLMEFSEKADKAAVDLKAAALPGQQTNVILPDPKIKPTEIYAPNYSNGEVLSLIRYPHGGTFEIPTLTVNNKGSEYRKIIGPDAQDAVAIHPEVATKLSGADFDGDFVLTIPNKSGLIRTSDSLEALKGFDPIREYPKFEGMKVMPEKSKGLYMGGISNLITDMTIKGAPEDEIARAVRHSMVVIDAPKHELNWKASERDNGIAALKIKYQGGANRGASTLISKARSQTMEPARRDHFGIDEKTGEKVYSYTEEVYINRKTGAESPKLQRSQKLAETKDPYSLTSDPKTGGTAIERVYAEHSLAMKDIANRARLASLEQKDTVYNRAATKTYAEEVASLDAKYKRAVMSRPVERKAQILGGEIYKSYASAAPEMSYADKRKAKARALNTARTRIQAKKPVIEITPQEWTAIEMGAVSPTRLKEILRNADMDLVRGYATPRTTKSGLSGAKETRAKSLLKAGYTNKEVALALGVPVTQIRDIDKK